MTIAISGSGTIVGLSAPVFSATCSTGASMPNSTGTKLLYQTEEFDIGGCYDAPNSKFIPNVAGYYQINAAYEVGGSNGTRGILLYKNGSAYKYGSNYLTAGDVISGAWLVYLNGTTDYIEIYGIQGVGTTQTQLATASVSWISGYLARAA